MSLCRLFTEDQVRVIDRLVDLLQSRYVCSTLRSSYPVAGRKRVQDTEGEYSTVVSM
jgi:hypothetical protein